MNSKKVTIKGNLGINANNVVIRESLGIRIVSLLKEHLPLLLLLAAALGVCAGAHAADAPKAGIVVGQDGSTRLTIRRSEDGIEVSESGKPVLFFQTKSKSLEGKWPRANYVHPLYGLDGQVLTEDFPEDHRHQRGVFWAWHQLRWHGKQMADSWECRGIEWLPPEGKGDGVRTITDNGRASISVVRDWAVSTGEGKAKRLVHEDVNISVGDFDPGHRALDFTIRLLALEPGVTIGGSEDAKGYGGFSPRLKLADDVRFAGPAGPLQPQATAVDAGAWMRLTGTNGESPFGVTIMSHPSHPDFPPKWILRSKNSMQNVAWPGRTPVALDTKSATILRYRLLIDRGGPSGEKIEGNYKVFSALE